MTEMRGRAWWGMGALGLLGCSGSQNGAAPAADPLKLRDPPPVVSALVLDGVSDAIDDGRLDPTEGRIALLRAMLGGDPGVSADLLAPTTPARTPPHLQVADFAGLWSDATQAQRVELRRLVGVHFPEFTGGPLEQQLEPRHGPDAWRLPAPPERAWCVYQSADDGRIRVLLPYRERCDEDTGGQTVEDEDGFYVPAGCHPYNPGTAIIDDCTVYSDWEERVRPQSLASAPAVLTVAEQTYATLREKMALGEASPESRRIDIHILDNTPANWQSFGLQATATPTNAAQRCQVFLSATPSISLLTTNPLLIAEYERITANERALSNTVHELFHCGQYFSGFLADAPWVVEGSANWAEDRMGDELWPHRDVEHVEVQKFMLRAWEPFLDGAYSNAYAYMFAGDTTAAGRDWVFDWFNTGVDGTMEDTLVSLVPDFPETWHALSLSTWNRAPVEIYTNDDRAFFLNARDGESAVEIQQTQSFPTPDSVLEPLSFGLDRFAFADDVDRVLFQLPDPAVSDALQVSVILESEDDPQMELLTGESEFELCRRAVGVCHDRSPDELHPQGDIAFIYTNTAHDPESGQPAGVGLQSGSPKLDGTWVTQSTTADFAGVELQSGGVVVIDEQAAPDAFSEHLANVVLGARTETCETTGSASGVIDIRYDAVDDPTAGIATGTLTVNVTDASPPRYTCVSEGPDGFPVERTGNTFGLWIFGQCAAADTCEAADPANPQGSPWVPLQFALDGDSLTLTASPTADAVVQMVLQRQPS